MYQFVDGEGINRLHVFDGRQQAGMPDVTASASVTAVTVTAVSSFDLGRFLCLRDRRRRLPAL